MLENALGYEESNRVGDGRAGKIQILECKHPGVDREKLVERLDDEFGGSEAAQRAVSRQARDLADSGRIEAELDYELTIDAVVSNLADAPAEYGLVERWNWWIGALELSHEHYRRFHVRPELE